LAGIVDGTSPSSLGVVRVDTPEQAREQVQRYKAEGFQQIKVYSSVKPDILKVVTAEAHRLGMTVTGHVPQGMTALQVVESGMDQINHISYLTAVMVDPETRKIDPDSPRVKDVLKFLLDHHTVVDPTISLMELVFHQSGQPVSVFEPGILKVTPELREGLESMGVPADAAARSAERFKGLLQTIQLLHQAGVPMVVGTDQAVPGYSIDREMELYVKAGFTPMEAIQAATLTPARAMGLEKDSGTVEVGKRADVIVVDGNPLDNISDIRKVSAVFTGGRMFQPGQLWTSVGFKP